MPYLSKKPHAYCSSARSTGREMIDEGNWCDIVLPLTMMKSGIMSYMHLVMALLLMTCS